MEPTGFSTKVDVSADATASGIGSSLRCHVGAVRLDNQDRVGRSVSSLGELFVVADGVGGARGGAEAATIAVEEFESLQAMPGEEPVEALQRATRNVNKRINLARQANSALNAMASTVAVVLVQHRTAFVGHLGDSRVILARAGAVRSLTRDHSVVRRMLDDGLLTEDEARTHPSGHILTHSLGQDGVLLESYTLSLEQHDVLLLCSDGLWAYVSEDFLSKEITRSPIDVNIVADALLSYALSAGAPDNISIALLVVGALPTSPSESA